MAGLNVAIRNAELDHFGSLVTLVSLHTADPGAGPTADAGELSGGSPAYARKAVTWVPADAAAKSNASAIVFDVPGGSTVTHVGLYGSGGTFYGSRALSSPETFGSQGTFTIAIGNLTETLA